MFPCGLCGSNSSGHMESVNVPTPLSPDPAFESTRPKREQKWRKVSQGTASRRNMRMLSNLDKRLETQRSKPSITARASDSVSSESRSPALKLRGNIDLPGNLSLGINCQTCSHEHIEVDHMYPRLRLPEVNWSGWMATRVRSEVFPDLDLGIWGTPDLFHFEQAVRIQLRISGNDIRITA